jgi:hypothetical protein
MLPPGLASGPVFWVDTAVGDDRNDGLSPRSALRTFAALKEIAPTYVLGQTVSVNIMANVAHGRLERTGPPLAIRPRSIARLADVPVMDLELGTIALVGSTYYRLEEDVGGPRPGAVSLPPLHGYYAGWSLRVDAPPQRGYFRKVALR